jgi:2-keto-4-pentenoate hydratase/2-oxohepta-3-ene-1,7-dioic acid hydratase in catechol pathway
MIRLTITGLIALVALSSASLAQEKVTKYVRYSQSGTVAYGILRGDVITRLDGELFASSTETDDTVPLSEVRILPPCEPSKVIAVGLNYRSHLGDRETAEYPGLFAKYPTSIVGHEDEIVMPPDSRNLHYEGEMVVVIGKRAKNVEADAAAQYIFGVTAGNDVSERDWQRDDLQWLRAKASDTFGPIGPVIVSGLDYNDLLLETRVNGETRQSARTSDLIFDVPAIVSYVSRYVTLLPGDVIFTGTPGTTMALNPADVVEVELEGVGVLRNTVVKAGENGR